MCVCCVCGDEVPVVMYSLGDEVPGWDVTNDLSRQITALNQMVCGYLGHG